MSQQDCPSREQMAAYLSGSLEAPAADRLVSHLEGCADCQAALQTLSDVGDTLLEQLRAQAEDSPYLGEPECRRVVERAVAAAEDRESVACSAAQETAAALPAALAQLAEYQVLEKLGRGGMGEVYKARHTRLGRNVAIKVLLEGRSLHEQAVARFLREMKAVGGLSHPNIVHAHDAREVGGTHVLVMEYVDGLSVGDLLRRLGPLPVAEACEVVRQAAAGLDYAHRQGMVHRDVKPTNLMLDRQGQVKILDLGLALLASDPLADEEITAAGQVMGTADYMAPEQVSDSHNVDARADIYSLGCALYALLAGRPPFHAASNKSVVAKMMAHLHEEPTPIGEVRADVPAGLAAALGRMMAKHPGNRFVTADDVRAALSPFCPGADLPGLLARASAPSVAPLAGPAPQPEPLSRPHTQTLVPAVRTAGKPRRLRPTAALVAAASLFAAILLGIIIKIRTKDGQDITVNVPPGSTVTIQDDGKTEVVIAGKGEGKTAATPMLHGSAPVGRPTEPPKPASRRIEPEPPATQIGEPIVPGALVSRPAALPGVKSWTLATREHRGWVSAVAYSPDGKWIASAGRDHAVRVRLADTGEVVHVLVGHAEEVRCLAWSPDGRILVSSGGGWDPGFSSPKIQFWEAATGRLLRGIVTPVVTCLAWSSDGRTLVFGTNDTIVLHDVQSGKTIKTFQTPHLQHFAWSPDNRTLVAATEGNATLRVLDAESGKERSSLTLAKRVYSVAWSPDGKRIVAAGDDPGIIFLADAETGRTIGEFPVNDRQSLRQVAFSPDGTVLAASGSADKVYLCETSSGKRLPPVPCEAGGPLSFAWSPDGKTIAAAGTNGVTATETKSGKVLHSHLEGPTLASNVGAALRHRTVVEQLAWSPGGRDLAVQLRGFPAVLNTSDLRAVPRSRDDVTVSVSWAPDAAKLATWNMGSARVWTADLSELLADFEGPGSSFTVVAWSPDATRLAAGTAGNKFVVYDFAAKQSRTLEADAGPISALAWSPDGKLLAAGSEGATVTVWNAQQGTRVHSLQGHSQGVKTLAWSLDGKLLATASCNCPTRVWDMQSGTTKPFVDVDDPQTGVLAFTPAGNNLVVATPNAGRSIRDVASGKSVSLDPEGYSDFARFSDDGKRLMILGRDNIIHEWNLAADKPLARRQGPPLLTPLLDWCSKTDIVASARQGNHDIYFWKAGSGNPLATATFLGKGVVYVSPEGHWCSPSDVAKDLVYVLQTDKGQESLTPEEFSQRFDWKNDPTKVTLTTAAPAPVAKSPAATAKPADMAKVPAGTPPAPKTPPADAGLERRLAQLALSVGSWVNVRTPDGERRIHSGQPLPAGSIQLLCAHLTGDRVTDDAVAQLAAAPSLRELEVSYASQLTDAALEHLAKFRDLRILRLSECRVTDQGMRNISGLKSLSSLVLDRIPITDAGLESIAGIPELAQLDLERLPGVTGAGLKHFQSHPKLNSLYLVSLALKDAEFEHVGRIKGLQLLSLMQTPVGDAALERLKGLTNLVRLHLAHTRVTNEGMRHLQGMKNLIDLNLSGTAVGDAGLKHLEGMRGLATLRLDGTAVTDDGLKHVGAMGGVYYLDLSSAAVGDAGVSHLAPLKALGTLHLAYTRVTDSGAKTLGRIPSLTDLNLSFTRVTDEGLRNLVALPNLVTLVLDATRVTDAGLEHIIAMPKLANVSLVSARVSDKGFAMLEAAMPKGTVYWWEPNRTAAEFAIALGGTVSIRVKDRPDERSVKTAAELPTGLFQVTRANLSGTTRPFGKSLEHLTLLIDPEFDRLEQVDLSRTTLGDADLPMLARLATVVELSLAGTQITDQGLAQWKGMPKLRRLVLDGTALRGPGLAGLKSLPALTDLQLACPTLTDFASKPLAELRGLKRLSLPTSAVTDEGLAPLGSLQGLEELDLTGTKVTPQGVDALRKKLRKCRVLFASPSGKQ